VTAKHLGELPELLKRVPHPARDNRRVSDDLDALVVKLKDALLAALDACDPPVEVSPGVHAGTNLPELLAEALPSPPASAVASRP